jgi:UDP-3-O-[3-hydroxymyristoyl] glucosamine N-acyltransferase
MTTFAVTDPAHTIAAINYALSNLGTGNSTGNTSIPGNVLVANTTTGIVSTSGNTAAVSYYLYPWVNLRYSNNSTGGSGSFSTVPTNANYFGVVNSVSSAPSFNPTDYQWYQVAGGFGTTKIIYYSAIGGRQVVFVAANSAPSSDYVVSVANVAINLDVVTTAAGTPGQRGPVVMAAVVTTADPNTATSSTLTTWFSAPRNATSAPIGTGLIPVTGDTASFTYAAGAGQPQAAYSYNGSIWVPVDGQVISGNVIVRGTIAGNAMIANTITATQIAADTITGNLIAANTIAGYNILGNTIAGFNIIGNTITGNKISAGTITTNNFTANTINGNIISAGTITADQLAANAITANTVVSSGAVLGSNASAGFWLDGPTGNARFGNNLSIGSSVTIGTVISGGSLTSNSVGATQIVNGSITTDKFTANTINGNIISAGTITADQLSANALTANTVVSTGAQLGNVNSAGFWLQGNTGNARFGNSVSIGNQLRVGSSADIGSYLVVGTNAYISNNLNIGDNCGIGASLSVGANATIAANLLVGAGANIGTNARIGANLIVGNNANIGGNLLVSGLISSGNLIANTVATTTIVPNAVSGGINASTTSNQSFTNPATGVLLISNVVSTITTTQSNQPVYVWAQAYTSWGINASSANYSFQEVAYLQRVNSANVATNIFSQNFVVTNPSTQVGINFTPTWAGFIDIPPTPGTYTYRVAMTWNNAGSSPTSVFTVQSGTYGFRSVLTQTLKR